MTGRGVNIYASRLSGKEIISMQTGAKLGVIHDLLMLGDKIVAFLVDSDKHWPNLHQTKDGLYVIPISAFRSVGDVVVVDTTAIRPAPRAGGF